MATQTNSQSSNGGGPAAKDIFRGVAGAAALGVAGRMIFKETRRPKVLGVKVPRDVTNVDVKKLAKQVSKVAGQVERASEDVRMASAQAKRVAKKLS